MSPTGLGPENDCAVEDQQHLYTTDPFSRQRCFTRTITASVQSKENTGLWSQGVWRQDELIGGKPPIIKRLWLWLCHECPEIGTSSIDWAQLSRFYLKTETYFSLWNIVFWIINWTVDNVQKRNICTVGACFELCSRKCPDGWTPWKFGQPMLWRQDWKKDWTREADPFALTIRRWRCWKQVVLPPGNGLPAYVRHKAMWTPGTNLKVVMKRSILALLGAHPWSQRVREGRK
jgi:hypothetical protein